MREKILKGRIEAVFDATKIARLNGEDVKPKQRITILLDEISDEEFGKVMFSDKVEIRIID